MRQIDVAPPGQVHARVHGTGVQQTAAAVVKEFGTGLAWRTPGAPPFAGDARRNTPVRLVRDAAMWLPGLMTVLVTRRHVDFARVTTTGCPAAI
ncbi:hypothetical protein ACFYXJ_05435 [Streptomyces sp. NPDC002667]|uniref:hypothetical protein n=1 Tax=Streptomyces sp. NPDC002667 TaxID=3364657 RepID=UPI0036ADD916